MNEPTKEYASKLEEIIELALILKQESNFKRILEIIIEKAREYFLADITSIMMINPQTHNTIKTIYSDRTKSNDSKVQVLNSSISGWVIKFESILYSTDITKDARFKKNLFKDTSYNSVLCCPLSTSGSIIGTLLLIRENQSAFCDQDVNYLNQFSAVISPFLHQIHKIEQYFDQKISDNSLLDKYNSIGLIGKCRKFIELLKAIEIASKSDIRVQIEGESGTGKELVAKAIHQFSSRSQHKFFALDCGTIPSNLIESELFGHVKGAFSGATENHYGLIQEANNGTLFLDEIADITMALQKKLLRFLQEGEIRQIGSNKLIKVDVRVLSASSQSLHQLVQQKIFREDLFYRLNVYPIKIPPLKERKEDIPILANYFLRMYSKQHKKNLKYIHDEMNDYLRSYPWSGNIRELENFIEHLVVLAPPNIDVLDCEILPKEYQKKGLSSREEKRITRFSLFNHLARYEAELIRKILAENDWNQAKAARALKISESAIRYKIQKLGISRSVN